MRRHLIVALREQIDTTAAVEDNHSAADPNREKVAVNERGGAYWGEQAPPPRQSIGGNQVCRVPNLHSVYFSVSHRFVHAMEVLESVEYFQEARVRQTHSHDRRGSNEQQFH